MKVVEGMPKTYYHYPRIVAVAGVIFDKKVNVIPLVWHTGLSFSPPLYGISISPKRYSYELILKSGEFSVNFLEFKYRKIVEKWGSVTGREVDKLTQTQVGFKKGIKTDTPVLNIAYVVHECELIEHYSLGDHTLFVGLVKATHYREDYFDKKTMLKVEEISPLLYLGKHVYITVNPETKSDLDKA